MGALTQPSIRGFTAGLWFAAVETLLVARSQSLLPPGVARDFDPAHAAIAALSLVRALYNTTAGIVV